MCWPAARNSLMRSRRIASFTRSEKPKTVLRARGLSGATSPGERKQAEVAGAEGRCQHPRRADGGAGVPMALTKFVRNAKISRRRGYNFRSAAIVQRRRGEPVRLFLGNILKRSRILACPSVRRASTSGPSGVTAACAARSAALTRPPSTATVHFNKCRRGVGLSPCHNDKVRLCEGWRSRLERARAKAAAEQARDKQVQAVRSAGAVTHALVTCPACGNEAGGGKFCQSCGVSVAAVRLCGGCKAPLAPTAKFCGECGQKSAP